MSIKELSMSDDKSDGKSVGFEYSFGTYTTDRYKRNDCVTIKGYEHKADGSRVPKVYTVVNYKRPFYITKESFRNHEQKKEWEHRDRLQKFTSTQVNLPNAIQQALQSHNQNKSLRSINRSPYVYGADISTTSLLKYQCQKKYPKLVGNPSTVAALDTETDVVYKTNEINIISITFKSNIVTAVVRGFFEVDDDDTIRKGINDKFQSLLADDIKERDLKLNLGIFDNAGQACHWVIRQLNELKPDFVSIWNILFDVPKIMEALEKYGFDLADTFSDVDVPKEFKYFDWWECPPIKKKKNGDEHKLNWFDRWHKLTTPSGSFWLDAAVVYRTLRLADGLEPSYALDSIMKKHVSRGKLKFTQTDHLEGLAWHIEMQSNYKYEYVVYNIFDCIGLELLDEETKDLSSTLPLLSRYSDYHIFQSGPSQISDDLSYYVQEEKNMVIGTVSDRMEDELEEYVVNRVGWILTLPSYMVDTIGLHVIEGILTPSYLYGHCADLDIEGTYPNLEFILNLSKETTWRELVAIEGLHTLEARQWFGIDLSGAPANAQEIASKVYQLPSYDDVLKLWDEAHA